MKNLLFIFTLFISVNVFASDVKTIVDQTNESVKSVNDLIEEIKTTDVTPVKETVGNLQNSVTDMSKEIQSVLPDSTTQLNIDGKYYEDIKEFLKSMANGLKVGVEEVFDVIVTQQIVKSFAILLGLLGLIFLNIKVFKFLANTEEPLSLIIPFAVMIISSIAASKYILTMLTGFINPKFGAYMDIITFIQQIR